MRLRELEAVFVRVAPGLRRNDIEEVTSIDQADGVSLCCPVCWERNGGRVGTHHVILWRPRIGQETYPVPGRWEFEGTGLDDLTLVSGSSSVQLVGGCNAHFFVRGGEIVLA